MSAQIVHVPDDTFEGDAPVAGAPAPGNCRAEWCGRVEATRVGGALAHSPLTACIDSNL